MRAILTWHSIDGSGSPISVDEDSFARHVAFLASGRVRVVPLEDLPGLPGDGPAVALTFDDGFRNFAETAWPRLRDAGLPATVFLVSDHVGGDNRWGGRQERGIPDLPLMDWDAAARAASEGASLGSHTRRHPVLPSLDDAALGDELDGSRERITARTGAVPRTFAYPYGVHDARSAAAVRRRYGVACTTELRSLAPGDDAALLPRLDAWYLRAPGRLEGFGTPAFRRYVRARAFLREVRARFTPSHAASYGGAAKAASAADGASL